VFSALVDARSGAASERAERIEADGRRARNALALEEREVGVEEAHVAELVVGVVVDVLRHVAVEVEDRRGVERIAAAPRHFSVLDATELVVLLPEVALDDLDRGQEPQKRDVSRRGDAAGWLGEGQ
jgi:hypothetical protein